MVAPWRPWRDVGGCLSSVPVSPRFPAPAPAPSPLAAMTETHAVVTWEGPGEPIMLTVYGADVDVAVPLLPKRALSLAQELLTRGVQAIKADSWDDMYGQGVQPRAPDLGAAGG